MTDTTPYPPADPIDANERNLAGMLALQAGLPGSHVRHDAAATWVAHEQGFFWFNMACALRLEAADVDPFLAQATATHGRLGTSLTLWLSPHGRPDDLPARLERAGFRLHGRTPGMTLDLARLRMPEAAAEASVERVADAATAAVYTHTLCEGYHAEDSEPLWQSFVDHVGLDPDGPLHHFLASWQGRPAAAASLYLADGVAGLYAVVTLEAARRKGLGALVSAAPLAWAAERGYETAILQSSAMGLGLYRRLGFEETFAYDTYGWSPAAG